MAKQQCHGEAMEQQKHEKTTFEMEDSLCQVVYLIINCKSRLQLSSRGHTQGYKRPREKCALFT